MGEARRIISQKGRGFLYFAPVFTVGLSKNLLYNNRDKGKCPPGLCRGR